jgi:hypothetical protein
MSLKRNRGRSRAQANEMPPKVARNFTLEQTVVTCLRGVPEVPPSMDPLEISLVSAQTALRPLLESLNHVQMLVDEYNATNHHGYCASNSSPGNELELKVPCISSGHTVVAN